MRMTSTSSTYFIVFLNFLYLDLGGFGNGPLTSTTATPLLGVQVEVNKVDIDEVIPVSHTNEIETGPDIDKVLLNPPGDIIVGDGDVKVGGCPCIDVSSVLASLPSRSCQLSNGKIGVKMSVEIGCVPLSYGSSKCLQHDLFHNPSCSLDRASEISIPAYCIRAWCYVDAESCMKDSHERIYRSDVFSFDSGVDLFYSYTNCNSTADDWFVALEGYSEVKMNNITIRANVPKYMIPMIYKKDPLNGEILASAGNEYYNNSLPFKGIYADYMKKLVKISNGDFRNIIYTYRSKSSSLLHPNSSFTAAVQDIMDGLVDMSVGPFWITCELFF